jgi:transcriptional regulator with XRE-family HTH domain
MKSNEIGLKIIQIRKEIHMSQKDLASRSKTFIHLAETNKNASLKSLAKIANALESEAAFFLNQPGRIEITRPEGIAALIAELKAMISKKIGETYDL